MILMLLPTRDFLHRQTQIEHVCVLLAEIRLSWLHPHPLKGNQSESCRMDETKQTELWHSKEMAWEMKGKMNPSEVLSVGRGGCMKGMS